MRRHPIAPARRLPQILLLTAACLMLPETGAGGGRTPLWEPTVITTPGSYVVTRDITSAGVVLDVQVSGVTVDLNGFTLESTSTTDPAVRVEGLADQSEVSDFAMHGGYVIGGKNNFFAPNSRRLRFRDMVFRSAAEDCVHAITINSGILLSMDESFCWECGQAGVKTSSSSVSYVLSLHGLGLSATGGPGLDITNAGGSGIDYVTMDSVGQGIRATDSSGVHVKDVTIANSTGVGVELLNSDEFTLTRVEVLKAGDDCFRGDFGSDGNRIVYGNFSGCLGEGMEIQGSRNVLGYNSATGNASFGVLLIGGLATHVRSNDADQNGGDPLTCANPAATADYCDDGSLTKSDGNNLLPGPC